MTRRPAGRRSRPRSGSGEPRTVCFAGSWPRRANQRPPGDRYPLVRHKHRHRRSEIAPNKFSTPWPWITRGLFEESREAVRRREEALKLHCSIEEQLSLLVEASGSSSASLDLRSVSSAIVALSRRLVAADAYAVWHYEASTGSWRIDMSSGLSDQYQHSTIPVFDHTPPLPASPIIAEDVADSPILADRKEAYAREGIKALLIVPLTVRGQRYGTIAFYYRGSHRFTEVEVRVATALSNLAAAAIGSAQLYEELEGQRPAQGRVFGDARARAAKSPRCDRQCCRADQPLQFRPRAHRRQRRGHRPPRQTSDSLDRRFARRVPDHQGKDSTTHEPDRCLSGSE